MITSLIPSLVSFAPFASTVFCNSADSVYSWRMLIRSAVFVGPTLNELQFGFQTVVPSLACPQGVVTVRTNDPPLQFGNWCQRLWPVKVNVPFDPRFNTH